MLHRNIDYLNPRFATKVVSFLHMLNEEAKNPYSIFHKHGIACFIIRETLREVPVQMAKATRGRMSPEWVKLFHKKAGIRDLSDREAMTRVTDTLESKHLEGLAADIVPTLDMVTPWWSAPEEVWERMYVIAEIKGLVCQEEVGSPHFEELVRIHS